MPSLMAYRFDCQVPEKTGPDFVLVHGIGVSARMYGPTAVELAQRGDVHLIDMAGYGRRAAPGPRLDHRRPRGADRAVPGGARPGSPRRRRALDGGAGRRGAGRRVPRTGRPHRLDRSRRRAPSARSLTKAVPLLLANGLKEPVVVMFLAVYDYLFRTGGPLHDPADAPPAEGPPR